MDNIKASVIALLSSSTFLFILIPVLFVVIAAVYVNRIFPFLREKKYIQSEIERTSGHEQRRWKRRLRRLYVRNIPLIGWILVKFMKRKHHHH